ncbi:MAG: hypothetical protein U1E86_26895 [Burkholderiaceae bacterium]
MIHQAMRFLLLAGGLLCAVLAVGYFLQLPWALATWPWQDGRLGNIFVSSVLAAVAAAMLWIGLSAHFAGAAGGFLHLATMLGGAALELFRLGQERADPRLTSFALALAAAAAGSLAALAWARGRPLQDARRLPGALRVWCVLYMLIVIPAGIALIRLVPGIMPWPLEPESSTLYGWIFVAAAWSFAYPLLKPAVEHIRVGLFGFLAYDAVLIPPFLRHFDAVRPELRTSLSLYVVALSVSMAVSIYYLFVSRHTRIGPLRVAA